jgi:glucokinase
VQGVVIGSERPLADNGRTSHMGTIVGLDIGGSKIAVVLGTSDAQILERLEMPTLPHTPFVDVLPGLARLIDELLEKGSSLGRRVVALSVSVGGPLRIQDGMLLDPPHLPGWHNVNLKERLAECFPGLPVFVEHDGNAGALAEFHFGVGRERPGLRHVVFLTFGTGLGAGLIVNGQIVHGATDTAGEVGHWRMSSNGPMAYGKIGSWEAFASGAGLVQLASQRFPQRWYPTTPTRELVEAMLAGDEDALSIATESATWMGRGLALLVDALNPQVIVLGSLAVVLGERVLAPMRRVVAKEALPQATAACEILPAALGARIGDVASLMAALSDPSIEQVLGSNGS